MDRVDSGSAIKGREGSHERGHGVGAQNEEKPGRERELVDISDYR